MSDKSLADRNISIGKEKSSDPRVFYIVLICAIAVVQIALKVFTAFVPDAQSQVLSRIVEVSMLPFAVYFVTRTTFVQPWFGLKVEREDRRRTLTDCLLLAVVVVAVFIAARLVLARLSPAVAQRPFFRTYLDIKHRRYYIVFVLVQEILAKGVLQYGIEETLPEDRWYIALPVSALVFGMLHIQHTLYYILGAIGLALVSGVLYHRQRNIWSSVVLHFMVAFLPRCFGLK